MRPIGQSICGEFIKTFAVRAHPTPLIAILSKKRAPIRNCELRRGPKSRGSSDRLIALAKNSACPCMDELEDVTIDGDGATLLAEVEASNAPETGRLTPPCG